MHQPYLYFDTRDGEWSVRARGVDLSDLVACHDYDIEIVRLGNDAHLLNGAEYKLAVERRDNR